jgi:hypothetical protein
LDGKQVLVFLPETLLDPTRIDSDDADEQPERQQQMDDFEDLRSCSKTSWTNC